MNKQYRHAKIAAGVLFLLGISLWQLDISMDGTSRVYAMSDIPEIFGSARTLHIKSSVYIRTGLESDECFSVEDEMWIDLENHHWKKVGPNRVNIGNSKEDSQITYTESIYNGGEYELTLDRQNQTATRQKMTPFRKAKKIRETVDLLVFMNFGTPSLFDQYKLTGHEHIDGTDYEVWQKDIQQGQGKSRLKSWFSSKTGQVLRSEALYQRKENAPWIKTREMDVIERNMPIDDSIFQQSIPKGYRVETIDTTITWLLFGGNNELTLSIYLLLQLDDGSVISCWKSQEVDEQIDQAQLCENLKPGNNFAKLPVVVYGLSTQGSHRQPTHRGVYLTHTILDSDIYLWGLYVPKETKKSELDSYTICHQSHSVGKKLNCGLTSGSIIRIENEYDFETFVLGGIADFSDPTAPLPNLTYNDVMQLAETVRTRKD